ncbi:hypothetical protein B1M_30950, partial [Burkholderia sp. TJI49]
ATWRAMPLPSGTGTSASGEDDAIGFGARGCARRCARRAIF